MEKTMHGSSGNRYHADYYNFIARDHVARGDLKTVRNGAMFWAFDNDPVTNVDLNFALLEEFKAHAAARGETMQSLRDLPKYGEFRGGIGLPASCDIYSSGFARGIEGDTITVAVDNATPADYFRLSEVGVLLNNPALKTVRRLSPGASGKGFTETMYDSVPEWMAAQQKQWFNASLARTEHRMHGAILASADNDLLGEMKELRARFNGPARLHEATEALRVQDQALFARGQDWIRGVQGKPILFHALKQFL
jgi:hypothetical protein